MKTFKYILSLILITTLIWSCNEDNFGDTNFLDSITVPSNVAAAIVNTALMFDFSFILFIFFLQMLLQTIDFIKLT